MLSWCPLAHANSNNAAASTAASVGENHGRKLYSDVRSSLRVLGWVDENTKQNATIEPRAQTLPRLDPASTDVPMAAFPVVLGGKIIAYAEISQGGRLAGIYGPDGAFKGIPLQLLSDVRGGLALRGLIAHDKLENIDIDFEKMVQVPEQLGSVRLGGAAGATGLAHATGLTDRPDIYGFAVKNGQEIIGYAKPSGGGRLSVLYKPDGTSLGNPVRMRSELRRSLLAHELVSNRDLGRVQIDMDKVVSIPSQGTETDGLEVRLDGKIIAYVKRSPSGHLSVLYGSDGRLLGNFAFFMAEVRDGLAMHGRISGDAVKTVTVDYDQPVEIPGRKGEEGLAIFLGGTTIGYAIRAPGGHLSALYDQNGSFLGNPYQLMSSLRSALTTHKMVSPADLGRVKLDLSRQVEIPLPPGDGRSKRVRGVTVTLDGVIIGYVHQTPSGLFSDLYRADGARLGNSSSFLSRLRIAVVANRLVTEPDFTAKLERLSVDLSKLVDVPNRPQEKGVMAHAVTLDSEVIAYAMPSSHGSFSGLYGKNGDFLGNPARLLSGLRAIALRNGLVTEEQAKRLSVDLSGVVAVPSRKDARGYPIAVDGEIIGYAKQAEGGHAMGLYGVDGTWLLDPELLLGAVRRTLAMRGIRSPKQLERMTIDLNTAVPIPNQSPSEKATGFVVSVDGETLGFVQPTPGGNISALHDSHGRPLGNPPQMLTSVRRALKLIGAMKEDDTDEVRIAFDTMPHMIFKADQLVAKVAPSKGGNLSKLFDAKGNDWGHPGALFSQVRWCIGTLEPKKSGTYDDIEIDFEPLMDSATQRFPVRENGHLKYYAVPHPKSGNLLRLLDSNSGKVLYERKGRFKMGRAGFSK